MKKQQGMSLIGMIFTAAVVVMFAVILMRVVPVYMQHYTIINSVKSLNELPPEEVSTSSVRNLQILKKRLSNQLYVNQVDEVVKDGIEIKPEESNQFKVILKYKVTKPLVHNISLLFNFEDEIEVDLDKN